MSEEDLLPEKLAAWLEPSGVQLDNERIPLYLAAVRRMAEHLAGRELDVVHAAHGDLNDAMRTWIASVVRAEDSAFVVDGKDALLMRLAGAAVMHTIATSLSAEAILVNLAVESATFLGLDPVIDGLSVLAPVELRRTAFKVREAVAAEAGSATDAVGKLSPERKADAESGQPVAADVLAKDLYTGTKAIRALVAHLDRIETARAAREMSLEEEVDVLWWVLRGRDANGTPWSDLTPAVRAVTAAAELYERTTRVPGPPHAGQFLVQALGDQAETNVSVGDLATATAEIIEQSGADGLLPITSTVTAYREVNGDKKLWPGLAKNKFGVSAGQKCSLESGAEQLYRELQMLELIDG